MKRNNLFSITISIALFSFINLLCVGGRNKNGYELIRGDDESISDGKQRGSPALKWGVWFDINHPNAKQFLKLVEQGNMNQVNAYLKSTSFKENISPALFQAAQRVARDSGHTDLDKKFTILLSK